MCSGDGINPPLLAFDWERLCVKLETHNKAKLSQSELGEALKVLPKGPLMKYTPRDALIRYRSVFN